MHLAMSGLFRAKWSNLIHDEWIRNVLKNRPDLSPDQLARTRLLMDAHARDCVVEGFEHLIESIPLPDPNDRHVVAAAIAGKASKIVTFNMSDFPTRATTPFGIKAVSPDNFICELLDLSESAVCTAVRNLRQSLRNPPKTASEVLERLEAQRLPKSVARLQTLVEDL